MARRPLADLLILMVAGTVCAVVLLAVIAVGIDELVNPERNNSSVVSAISDVINTLIGLLAGFLAGKTHAAQEHKRDEDDHE